MSTNRPRKKVIISSTQRDLSEHRRQVIEACVGLDCTPLSIERFGASNVDVLQESLRLVDEADIYIGIFAHQYGYVPPGYDVSLTELEYQRAVERRIPRLVFFMDEQHPIKAEDVEKGAAADKLQRLKERIGQDRLVGFFTSKEDLQAQVVRALSTLLVATTFATRNSEQIVAPRSQTTSYPEFFEAGVVRSGVADEASAVDHLGFEPYVTAVAAFLTHPNTPAPLTMSIEGPWGSGKSSFMRQLETKLTPKFRTIRFNAWRHEKAEELWAAFALHFLQQIKPNERLARWRAELRLAWRQFDLASGWPDLVRVTLWFLALASATITLASIAAVSGPDEIAALAGSEKTTLSESLGKWFGPPLGITGWFVGASALAMLWQKFFRNIKSPLEIDLRKYLKRPDYEAKLAFIERFQKDLSQATETYLENRDKVFVFIDDLDRCELPQAAELMRAINLMLSESGPIVFVIGMDREKVAAALAVKHEKLLPYLATDVPRKTTAGEPADSLRGIMFGYGFIEKFIQIPFAVPEPTEANIDLFLASLTPTSAAPGQRTSDTGVPKRDEVSTAAPADRPTVTTEELHEFIRQIETETETENFAQLIKLVAPSLGNNPRRLKQFINMFRLRTLIGFATGLFLVPSTTEVAKRVTLQKLAKFVAVELRWPLLLTQLENEPALVGSLEKAALKFALDPDAKSFRVEYWSANPELATLLRVGFDRDGKPMNGDADEWLLGGCNLSSLMQVSVRRAG